MQLFIQVSPFFPPTLKSLTICTHPEWQAWRASRPPPPGIRSNYRPTGLLSHCRLPAFADITFLLRLTTCTTLSADALHNEETMRVTTLPQLSIINFPPPFGTRSNIPPTPLHLFEYNRSSPSSSLFVRRRIKADEIAYYSRLNCENETLFISEKYEEFISFALESVCIYIYIKLYEKRLCIFINISWTVEPCQNSLNACWIEGNTILESERYILRFIIHRKVGYCVIFASFIFRLHIECIVKRS